MFITDCNKAWISGFKFEVYCSEKTHPENVPLGMLEVAVNAAAAGHDMTGFVLLRPG